MMARAELEDIFLSSALILSPLLVPSEHSAPDTGHGDITGDELLSTSLEKMAEHPTAWKNQQCSDSKYASTHTPRFWKLC